MAYKLSARSLARLEGVHPDLVAVVKLAIEKTDVDFSVVEGLRSLDRQRELLRTGKSRTMNSRHLTGHAVDLYPYVNGKTVMTWDGGHFHRLAEVIKAAADDLGVQIEWGGDWSSFKDGPHWQLPWALYDKTDMEPSAKAPAQTFPMPQQKPTATGGLLAFILSLFGVARP